MENFSRNDYLASIEESASYISAEIGPEVVRSVYQRFGVNSLDEIETADLPEVFSEIYAIEADLR